VEHEERHEDKPRKSEVEEAEAANKCGAKERERERERERKTERDCEVHVASIYPVATNVGYIGSVRSN